MGEKDRFIWLFFRLSGRVGRAAFFLGGMLLAVIQGFMLYRVILTQYTLEGEIWAIGFWVMLAISLWANVALGAKRLHDIDRPTVLAASLFVPGLSIVAFIALCLIPGTPGPNRFGAPYGVPGTRR